MRDLRLIWSRCLNSFEMKESRSVTPWVNRLYFESPHASSFLGLRLVKARHKNLVPLFSGVKPDPMVKSGRCAESIPVKSPVMVCGRQLIHKHHCTSIRCRRIKGPSPLLATVIIHFIVFHYPLTRAYNLEFLFMVRCVSMGSIFSKPLT